MKINIGELAQKRRWERRLPNPATNCTMNQSFASNPPQPMQFDRYPRRLLTQSDFLNEKQPSAHMVYDVYMRSNRPKYRYDEALRKNVPDGYEPVERVSVSLQKSILRHKTIHTFGNPMEFSNEGDMEDADMISQIKSYWNQTGMNNALIKFGNSCFGTGDGAICVYMDPETEMLGYRVFSYEFGDLITEFRNPRDGGKRNVLRMFDDNGTTVVEIYGSRTVERWESITIASTESAVKTFIRNLTETYSEDGYKLVSTARHGLSICPVIYHREADVCWGDVQGNIEDIEKLLSDLMENGKYYNFQMLFVSGIVGGLPNVNFQGKVIAARNKDGDAKILQPADASNTFTLSLDNSLKFLCDSVGAVFIRPDEIKSGDYSGAYLRNLYFPETQWCIDAYSRFDPALRSLMFIFKEFVGIKEKRQTEYHNLRMSYSIEPFIPKNDSEDIQNRVQAVAGGILSVRTAAEGSPLASFDELKRIELETAEKERKAQEQAAAELEEQQRAKAAAEGNGGADNDERNQMEKDGKMPNRVE